MMASVSALQVMHLDCKMMPMLYGLQHGCDSMHDQTGLVPLPRYPSKVCVMLVHTRAFVHNNADNQHILITHDKSRKQAEWSPGSDTERKTVSAAMLAGSKAAPAAGHCYHTACCAPCGAMWRAH